MLTCLLAYAALGVPPLVGTPSPAPHQADVTVYRQALRQQLEQEIQHFAVEERKGTAEQRTVIRASINVRIVAAELITLGMEADPTGDMCLLIGLRVAAGRGLIDELLKDGLRGGAETLTQIETFNDLALDHAAALRTIQIAPLDVAVARVFQPLATLAQQTSGVEVVDHWVVMDTSSTTSTTTTAGASEPVDYDPIETLLARSASAPLSAAAQTSLGVILEYIERGQRFHDIRPRLVATARDLNTLLDLANALQTATWLNVASGERWQQRIASALDDYADPEKRADAREAIVAMATVENAMESISRFPDDQVRDRTLVPLWNTLNAESVWPNENAVAALSLLATIVDRMTSFRTLERASVPRPLRSTRNTLMKAYRTAEKALLQELTRLGTDRDARADPAFVSVAANQRYAIEMLEDLAGLTRAFTTLRDLDPAAAKSFQTSFKRLGSRLVGQTPRAETTRMLSDLMTQVELFIPLPNEDVLTAPSHEVLTVTGGRAAELLTLAREARRTWSAGWDLPEAGVETERLEHLARLMATIPLAANMERVADRRGILNRWAAWEMPPALLERLMTELPNRCKLATATAINGDRVGLARHLAAINRERDVVQLVTALTLRLEPKLALLPDAVGGVLGQLVHPAPDSSRLRRLRPLIARVCLLTTEADVVADDATQPDQARALRAEVDALARLLFEQL